LVDGGCLSHVTTALIEYWVARLMLMLIGLRSLSTDERKKLRYLTALVVGSPICRVAS